MSFVIFFNAPIDKLTDVSMLINVPVPIYHPNIFHSIKMTKNKKKNTVKCCMFLKGDKIRKIDFDEIARVFIDVFPDLIVYLKDTNNKTEPYALRRCRDTIGTRCNTKKAQICEPRYHHHCDCTQCKLFE